MSVFTSITLGAILKNEEISIKVNLVAFISQIEINFRHIHRNQIQNPLPKSSFKGLRGNNNYYYLHFQNLDI